ncbi:MAG: hypothetical protein ACOVVK_07905 [Elsteraceae bacterium]
MRWFTPVFAALAIAAAPAAALDLNTQEIRGPGGLLLGKIVTTSSAKIEARDPFGRVVGYYDVKANETRDGKGNLVAKGNALAGLLTK